jgi:hypothetical protein
MSDNEVRLAVQRALDKLINRFGNPSEVIGELRAALAALDKQEAKGEAAVSPPPPAPKVEPEAEAEPPPKNSRQRSMGKKGHK